MKVYQLQYMPLRVGKVWAFIMMLAALSVGWLYFVQVRPSHSASKLTIYFYNPETNINNFASLKIEFDTYLSQYGSFVFQPFNDRSFFENYIRDRRDGVFLISSWHFRLLKTIPPLEPQLIGIYNGKSTYRRVLTTKKKVNNLQSLTGLNVASAGSEDYSTIILNQMMGVENSRIVDSLNILTVPKDIDALMSLGFGMAQAAITSEKSLNTFKAINPKQYRKLQRIAMSDRIPLPLIVVPKETNGKVQELVSVIESMGASPEGSERLKMLGLDGWKRLFEEDRNALVN